MRASRVLLFVATLSFGQFLPGVLSADNSTVEEDSLPGSNGVQTFINRHTGEIRLYRTLSGGNRTGQVGFSIDSITEVMSNGTAVGDGHGQAAAKNSVVITTTSRVNNTNVANSVGVTADCVSCNGTVTGAAKGKDRISNAQIELSVCAIKSNGTLTLDDESSTLSAGQLKFSFSLAAFSWSPSTEYIDVDVVIRVPGGRSVSHDNSTGGRLAHKPTKFSLGADAAADFSSKVFSDGAWRTMPDGYPQLTTKGIQTVITLRIPKFNTSCVYDPSFDVGRQADSNSTEIPRGPDGDRPSNSSTEERPLSGQRGLQMFVSRRGGVVRMFRNVSSAQRTAEISVYVDSIAEVQQNGSPVTGGGPHAVQSMGGVEFTVNVSNNVSLQNAVPSGSVQADCLLCEGTLTGAGASSNMSLMVCAVKNNGTIQLQDENSTVLAGQLKISFKLTSWLWSASGQYLDVDVIIKVPPGRDIKRDNSTGRGGKPAKFDLGDGAVADFSTKVLTDDVWTTMPADFPKYSKTGANHVIKLRLPRFNNSTMYDPTFDAGYQPATYDNGTDILTTQQPTVPPKPSSSDSNCYRMLAIADRLGLLLSSLLALVVASFV